jgi:hypothetical protein
MFKVKEGISIGGKVVTGSGPSAVLTAADVGTGAYSPAFNYSNPAVIGTIGGLTVGSSTTTATPLTVNGPSANGDTLRGLTFNIDGANYARILVPSGSGGALAFWTGAAGAAAERVRIDLSGNVGINAAPIASAKLKVYDTTYGATILFGASTNGAGQIGFDTTMSLTNTALAGNNLNTFLNAPNGYISFRVTNAEKMILTSGGLLGVGADPTNWYGNPTQLLIAKNQNAATTFGIGNTTVGTLASTQINLIGGTAYSYCNINLFDNNGVPYFQESYGIGVTFAQFVIGGVEAFRINQSGATTIFNTAIFGKKTAPTISTGTLTLDLRTSALFAVSLNTDLTTLTFSNPPASNTLASFTIEFTGDGTTRLVNWPGSIIWASGVAPTLTFTNGKKNVISFYTYDGGTTYIANMNGQGTGGASVPDFILMNMGII